jgi:hypothetical protein
MASPIWGNSGDTTLWRSNLAAGLIEASSRPITGAMFWSSPHARLLVLVVGSAVALALLAISPARRARHEHQSPTPTVTAHDPTPGAWAHQRRLDRSTLPQSPPS